MDNNNLNDSRDDRIKKVSELVKELIGDRSIRGTAEDTGVAASYITGILKERYLPSANILGKLAAPGSNPRNGVALEDLMIAAGYQVDYISKIYDSDIVFEQMEKDDPSGRLSTYTQLNSENDGLERKDRLKKRRQEIAAFESMMTGIIYRTLSEKGYRFTSSMNQYAIREYRPDMVIDIHNDCILEWWFEFKMIILEREENARMEARRILAKMVFITPKQERKISIVVNHKGVYDAMREYRDKLALRCDLSIILVDDKNMNIVDEVYLSHFDLYNSKSEFFIA